MELLEITKRSYRLLHQFWKKILMGMKINSTTNKNYDGKMLLTGHCIKL